MINRTQARDRLRKWLYSVRGDSDIPSAMDSIARRMHHEAKWNELAEFVRSIIDDRDAAIRAAEKNAEAEEKRHRAEVRDLKKEIKELSLVLGEGKNDA